MELKDYLKIDAISRADIINLLKSPYEFLYWRENKKSTTSSMALGSAFHTLALEPEEFEKRFVVTDLNLATKEGKEFKKNNTKTIIKANDFAMLSAMKNMLYRSRMFLNLLNDGIVEENLVFDSGRGFNIKGRPDLINLKEKVILDVKTTSSTSLRTIGYDIKDMGYDIQGALYRRGVKAVHGVDCDFILAFVEKNPIHKVTMVKLYDHDLSIANGKIEKALDVYVEAKEKNQWEPVVSDEIETVAISERAFEPVV